MQTQQFEKYLAPRTEMDRWDDVGKSLFQAKIDKFPGKPVFTMLGFPFKSINTRDKTLGEIPDLGEELSMQHLGGMMADLKGELKVVSDGYMFNHLMKVGDNTVAKYEEQLKELAPPEVEILNPWDFYDRKLSMNQIREKVIAQFGITMEELDYRILFDPEVKALYQGMIRFMHDDLAIWPYDSGNQLHKAAKKMARDMMIWNEAYSALIRTQLTEPLGGIRLSMHPSMNAGTKYSINLINEHSHQSPWHSCVVITPNGVVTMKRKDAEKMGELMYKDGKPYYFVQKQNI